MTKIKSLQVKSEDYKIILNKYEQNNKTYNQLFSGSRKTLLNEKNEIVCSSLSSDSLNIGDINKPYFFSFLAHFNKCLYKNIVKKNLFDFRVNYSGVSRKKNYASFRKLDVGDFFYIADLNSAYWQIAYKLGYIDSKLYFRYKDDEKYKSAKRLCISFLARNTKKIFYSNSGEFFTITCENNVLKLVYENIRKYLYCLFSNIAENTEFIAYNIDAIYVTKKDLSVVKEFLKLENLDYKLVLCQKISNTEFSYGKKTKKF